MSAVHRILFILNSLHHGGHDDDDDDDDDQVTDHRHQLDSKLASLLRIVVEDSTRFELLLYLPLVKIITDQLWQLFLVNIPPDQDQAGPRLLVQATCHPARAQVLVELFRSPSCLNVCRQSNLIHSDPI